MDVITTDFDGLLVVEPTVFSDLRGYFFESFNLRTLLQNNVAFHPIQDNESRSTYGVIRGLHYQLKPYAQTKLIRVVEGKILDVVLDLRRDSNTFMRYFSMIIDSKEKKQLLIPAGFAHGFSVLSEQAIISYKVDNYYNKESERGIYPLDETLKIDWGIGPSPILSQKDLSHPRLKEAEFDF